MTQHTAADVPPSLSYAQALLAQLIAQGVRDIVLCPGSRSAPLAYAVVQAQRAGLVRMHVRVDERTAGFLALGLAKGNGIPAAVFTTSGTAVANLHPAVLEAHHSNIPLIVLSADRPHELRGTGANQTTNQTTIFGDSTRLLVDISVPVGAPYETQDARAIAARGYAAAIGVTGRPGPVQLNLGFRDPLAPNAEQLLEVARRFAEPARPVILGLKPGMPVVPQTSITSAGTRTGIPSGVQHSAIHNAIDLKAPTVIIAGDGSAEIAGDIAAAQGWPIITEPSSGLVTHENAIPGAVNILARANTSNAPDSDWRSQAAHLVSRVKQVLVFGHPTLTRPVQQLLARPDINTVIFPSYADQWNDASRTANAVLYSVPEHLLIPNRTHSDWLTQWQIYHATLAMHLDQQLQHASDLTAPTTPMRVVRDLADASGPADTLVFGASSAIRDADQYVTTWHSRVVAHRGLAGIDGTISMALGVALNTQRTRLLVGDLTFLHDAGALLRGPQEPTAQLDIIVLNDNGGAIFGGLEHAAAGDKDLFERAFGTPHLSDLAALCAGYSVPHTLMKTSDDLVAFLSQNYAGIRVAEVQFGRAERHATHQELMDPL